MPGIAQASARPKAVHWKAESEGVMPGLASPFRCERGRCAMACTPRGHAARALSESGHL